MLKKRHQSNQSIIRGDESNDESRGSSRRIPKRHRTLDVIEPSFPSTSDRNSAPFNRSSQSVRSQSSTRPLAHDSRHSIASLPPQHSQSRSIIPPTEYASSQISDKSQSQRGKPPLRSSSVSRRPLGDLHPNDNDDVDGDFQTTQSQGNQSASRPLRQLTLDSLNRPKARSSRKSSSKKLEGYDFDILPDKCYQDLRKILHNSYNEALNKLDDSGKPRGHDSSTLTVLTSLIKRANKKMRRLLVPPNTPRQLFDFEFLKEKQAHMKQALAGDIADFAQLEVDTLNAERAIDLEAEEYQALQDQIQREEASRRKEREELRNRHALLDQKPHTDTYVWNLLRFPSSSFSQGQDDQQ